MNTYIADALARGRARAARERHGRAGADRRLRRRPGSSTSTAPASGTRCAPAPWSSPRGALNTPQLLLRSGLANAVGRAPSRPASRPPRLRPVRRAAGRAHGLSDHRALREVPARRGRRLRDRGDDHPGPDLLRDDAVRRERAALGTAPRRGRRAASALDRVARDGERRQQLGRHVVAEDGDERFEVDFQPAELERIDAAPPVQPRGARGCGRDAGLLDRSRVDARPGQLPDGRRPGAVGRRPERRVARGEAPLRRRRRRSSHARSR